jgi:hypothetical protein
MPGVAQGTPDQPAQRLDLPVVPPFATTRCRLSDTASSRAFSVSPAAASGARPLLPKGAAHRGAVAADQIAFGVLAGLGRGRCHGNLAGAQKA